MNRFRLLVLLTLITTVTFAQRNKPVTPAPRPTPKAPPPYVLKKDYEAQIAELNAKINDASNAAASVRRSVEGRLGQVAVLDSQLQAIETILNSASFQIAMNADSLRETKNSMDAFRQAALNNFDAIKAQEAEQSQLIWIVLGASLAVSVVVLLVALNASKGKLKAMESTLIKNEEILKKSISIQVEKAQKELKEEMQASESRILVDLSVIKREAAAQLNQEKQNLLSQLATLQERLATLEKPQEGEESDPETVI